MSTPGKRESMSPKPCIHMRLVCHFGHRVKEAEVDEKTVTVRRIKSTLTLVRG